MEEKYETVTFLREQMADFYDVILPDIYTELLGVEDFADEGVIAVGILRDGEPCGAAIGVFADEDVFSLISIMMAEEERRQGGGRLLIEELIREALRRVDWQGDDLSVKRAELRAEYVMDEDEIGGMDLFLAACGFRGFETAPPVYLLNTSVGRDLIPLTAFTDLPDEGKKFLEALEDDDLSPDAELSFYVGDAENASVVFLTNPVGDSTYRVTAAAFDGATQETYGQALLTVLGKIADADANATVIAPAVMHPFPAIPERLARESGTVCVHRRASCYILLQAEGNE